jgi:hypothetical protein
MVAPATDLALLLAQATTLSDLAPYVAVIVAGFLIGAWGQSARVPLAVAIGIGLIMLAIALFVLDNDSGSTGVPGLPGGSLPLGVHP